MAQYLGAVKDQYSLSVAQGIHAGDHGLPVLAWGGENGSPGNIHHALYGIHQNAHRGPLDIENNNTTIICAIPAQQQPDIHNGKDLPPQIDNTADIAGDQG